MAEPQPPDVHEGAADPHAPTGTADDRKAAAALSKLDAQDDTGVAKEVDGKALDKAMKGLSIKGGKAEDKKNIKIEAADVKLVMSECDLSKQKATDLLRANEGDVVRAMRAFVTAPP